jgi:hypothetical protein
VSTRNQPRQFARGVGQFSPWRGVDKRVRKTLTEQATPRKFQWLHGKRAAAWRLANRQRENEILSLIDRLREAVA